MKVKVYTHTHTLPFSSLTVDNKQLQNNAKPLRKTNFILKHSISFFFKS